MFFATGKLNSKIVGLPFLPQDNHYNSDVIYRRRRGYCK